MMTPRWALPEYIEDMLPAEAKAVERLRGTVLRQFEGHGYELVAPPMIEYLDSLLTGTGRDLDLRTFKLVDQLSGRTLGLRADITPQAARMDAHVLNRRGITRLCYAGAVLHTLPSAYSGGRESLQAGAELFGHAGIESDIEILQLMLRALTAAGVRQVHVDLGHVGVFRELVARASLDRDSEDALFRVLQAKDLPGLGALVRGVAPAVRDALLLLPQMYGGPDVIRAARRRLPRWPGIATALRTLERLVNALDGLATEVHVDLAELRGYRYHSGAVFAAYAAGCSTALARGGRYDEVGKAFGRARPATGFSLDLRTLAGCGLPCANPPRRVLAPYGADPALSRAIAGLRARGEVVVVDLPGHAATRDELACDFELVLAEGTWRVRRRGASLRRPARRARRSAGR